MLNPVLFSSCSEDWSTPQDLFDSLNNEFHFDLDVCASPDNAKCSRFFTKFDDALNLSWTGVCCWCNPPYGRNIIRWVEKAYIQHLLLHNTIVLLLPVRTDTVWFHRFIYHKAEIRFIKGRLHFSNSKSSAPFPSMLCIYRDFIGDVL